MIRWPVIDMAAGRGEKSNMDVNRIPSFGTKWSRVLESDQIETLDLFLFLS